MERKTVLSIRIVGVAHWPQLASANRFRHRVIEFRRGRVIRYIRIAARSQMK